MAVEPMTIEEFDQRLNAANERLRIRREALEEINQQLAQELSRLRKMRRRPKRNS